MKKRYKDFLFLLALLVLFLPFLLSDRIFQAYYHFNLQNGLLMSFIKFFFLATLGELIGLRIKTGRYWQQGFGLLPRALVWGFLGMTIYLAFGIFASGTPVILEKMGFRDARSLLGAELGWRKVLVSFSISTALNLFYAPVMMTFHKITDTHILETGGSLRGFFGPMDLARILKEIGIWNRQNGEAIFETRPWTKFGEGDVRFTQSKDGKTLYAIFLTWPEGGQISLTSLPKEGSSVRAVTMLGSEKPVTHRQDDKGLHLTLPNQTNDYAVVVKLSL